MRAQFPNGMQDEKPNAVAGHELIFMSARLQIHAARGAA
jgi:hypothetical protein